MVQEAGVRIKGEKLWIALHYGETENPFEAVYILFTIYKLTFCYVGNFFTHL